MSEAVSRNTKRIYKWDNLKCFLIVMVVIGHFVNQYAPISNTMKSLSFLFIPSICRFLFFCQDYYRRSGVQGIRFDGISLYIIL